MSPSPVSGSGPSRKPVRSPIPKLRTATRQKGGKRRAVLSQSVSTTSHRELDRQVREYLHDNKSNYQTLTRDQREELERRSAKYLYANNYEARIRYAERLYREMAVLIGQLARDCPISFVTLTPKEFVLSEHDAASIDVRALQRWTKQRFPGANLIGMVEAALFTNVGVGLDRKGRSVSWHVHFLLWGMPHPEVEQIKNRINTEYRSNLPGRPPAHFHDLSSGDGLNRVWYMTKGILSAYHASPRTEHIDPETGEVHRDQSGPWYVQKEGIRPGDAVKMMRVMERQCIDRLAFSAGAGDPVRRAVRHDLLREYRAERACQRGGR